MCNKICQVPGARFESRDREKLNSSQSASLVGGVKRAGTDFPWSGTSEFACQLASHTTQLKTVYKLEIDRMQCPPRFHVHHKVRENLVHKISSRREITYVDFSLSPLSDSSPAFNYPWFFGRVQQAIVYHSTQCLAHGEGLAWGGGVFPCHTIPWTSTSMIFPASSFQTGHDCTFRLEFLSPFVCECAVQSRPLK